MSAELEREARYLHELFFGCNAAPEVVERYVAASQLCLGEQRIASLIVEKRLDAEAIELVLRARRLDTVLTRKIQILFYLVEVRSHYYSYFVRCQEGRLRGYWTLAAAVIHTAWKSAKGMYLIRRYGLI